MAANIPNMAEILAALAAMNPDEKRRFALQAVQEAGLKLGTDTKYSRAVGDSRDMVYGAFPWEAIEAKVAEIPENVLFTLLSQGDGTARGSAGVADLPTRATGIRVKISVFRDAEAVPVKDPKTGKPIILDSGATKTKQEYKSTECAATLDGKGRLPVFVNAEEPEEQEADENQQ